MKSCRRLTLVVAIIFFLALAVTAAPLDDLDEELLIADALAASNEDATTTQRNKPIQPLKKKKFSSDEDDGVFQILVTNWGQALVDGAEIKKVLDEEENEIGITFDELSQLQQEFGKRTDRSKKRKGIDAIFNIPGAQVKPSNHGSQDGRSKPRQETQNVPALPEEAANRQPTLLRKIPDSGAVVNVAVVDETVLSIKDDSTSEFNKVSDASVVTTTTTTQVPITFPTRTRPTTTTTTTVAPIEIATEAAIIPTKADSPVAPTEITTTTETTTTTRRNSLQSSTSNPSILARNSLAPVAFSLTTEAVQATTIGSPTTTTSSSTDYDTESEEEDPEIISEATVVNSFESFRAGSGRRTTTSFFRPTARPTIRVAFESSTEDPAVAIRSEATPSETTETTPSTTTESISFPATSTTTTGTTESAAATPIEVPKSITFTIVTPERTTVTITKTPPLPSSTPSAGATAVNGVASTTNKVPYVGSRSRVRPLSGTGSRGDIIRTIGSILGTNNRANSGVVVSADAIVNGRATSAASKDNSLPFRRLRPVSNSLFNTVTEPTTTTTTESEDSGKSVKAEAQTTNVPTTATEAPNTVAATTVAALLNPAEDSVTPVEVVKGSVTATTTSTTASTTRITTSTDPSTTTTAVVSSTTEVRSGGSRRIGGRRPTTKTTTTPSSTVLETSTSSRVAVDGGVEFGARRSGAGRRRVTTTTANSVEDSPPIQIGPDIASLFIGGRRRTTIPIPTTTSAATTTTETFSVSDSTEVNAETSTEDATIVEISRPTTSAPSITSESTVISSNASSIGLQSPDTATVATLFGGRRRKTSGGSTTIEAIATVGPSTSAPVSARASSNRFRASTTTPVAGATASEGGSAPAVSARTIGLLRPATRNRTVALGVLAEESNSFNSPSAVGQQFGEKIRSSGRSANTPLATTSTKTAISTTSTTIEDTSTTTKTTTTTTLPPVPESSSEVVVTVTELDASSVTLFPE